MEAPSGAIFELKFILTLGQSIELQLWASQWAIPFGGVKKCKKTKMLGS
jgi:hypothetical protein